MQFERSAESAIQVMKEQGNFGTDAELADYLDVSKVTIASWRKRNSIPLDKLILFTQKALVPIENLIFDGKGGVKFNQKSDNYWAIAVAMHFYKNAADHFLHGDKDQTLFWWGKVFPALISYYEQEISVVSEKENLELEVAAIKIMRVIETLKPDEMVNIVESRRKETDDL